MIYRDNFRILSDKEKAQYKFEFCQGCALYDECELVDEYAQFRDNHPQIHKPKTSQFSGERPVVRATVVGYESTPTIDTGKDRLEYNKCADEILKNGCIMSSRHVYPIACDRKRVSDGIGDHYKIEAQFSWILPLGQKHRIDGNHCNLCLFLHRRARKKLFCRARTDSLRERIKL